MAIRTPSMVTFKCHYTRTVQILVLLCILSLVQCSDSETNEYNRMPALFHYENKLKCLTDNPSNIYCVARTIIKPEKTSEVWDLIDKYSRESTEFQHNVLDRGICLDACEELVGGLSEEQLRIHDHERIYVDIPYIYDSNYLPGMEEYKRTQGKLTNICLSYRLHRDYNLSSFSEIEHCSNAQDLNKPITVFHIVFATMYGTIMLLVVRATLRDNKSVRNVNNNQVTVELNSSKPENDIWMEFSLKRSVRRLLAEPRTKLQRDFAFVESIRVGSVFCITTLHTIMAFGASPMANPNALETLFGGALVRMASAVFPFMVHTFFTIGGVLLAVHFQEFVDTSPKFRLRYFFAGLMNRYLRMLPVYLVMWLYQVSWLDQIGNGPVAHRLVDIETNFCKTNGWSNFLFINNYYKYEHACMQQTWYMAADFQFFFIGMTIMMLLWKFSKSTNTVIIAMMTISIVAPVVNNYVYNFVGVILLNFKHLRFMLFFYEWMQRDYVLAHPHTCSYFSGIIAGIVYHRARKDPQFLTNLTIYKHLKWMAPLVVLALSAPATFFYDIRPTEPSLWMAIYASVHRNFFGIMCGTMLLYGATDGRKNIPAFANSRLLQAVGRLSFCVYLVQFNAIRTYFVNATGYGFILDVPNFIHACLVAFGVSYGAGLLLCTTVELPVAAVIKRLQGSNLTTKQCDLQKDMNGNGKIKDS